MENCFNKLNTYFDFLSNHWFYFKLKSPYQNQNEYLIHIYRYLTKKNLKFWYMRKQFGGSHLRIRVLKIKDFDEIDLIQFLEKNYKGNYFKNIYEPEIHLFGEESGLCIAHNIFCATSKYSIESYIKLKQGRLNTYFERGIWLTDYLIKIINEDSFERWDTWKKIELLRKANSENINKVIGNNIEAFNKITSLDENEFSKVFISKDDIFIQEYINDIKKNAELLKLAGDAGKLDRGIRSILSCIVIFIWNIMGYNSGLQSGIANLAKEKYSPD
ncbi:thiopeptide-type bacteriocin biosynthesis protein [Bacillus tropicus]|uniref:thiopeptide-type bacteriocin biosynthesis protein n=1 Tax=Bacillus tropicus TaxID=2026188 RepID=UPI0035E32BE2